MTASRAHPRRTDVGAPQLLRDDPHWYKDAIIYQLHVKAFMDSTNDGVGDFAGLAEKLDYIADLAVVLDPAGEAFRIFTVAPLERG